MIDNKKIPTTLGVIIIIIFAATVGMMVWRYEASRQMIEQTQMTYNTNNSASTQSLTVEEKSKNVNTTNNESESIEWNTFINDKYKFEIQYPSNFLYAEHSGDEVIHQPDVEYIINLGAPMEKVEGNNSSHIADNNFLMYIINSKNSFDDYIKNAKLTSGAVENSFESIGTSRIGNFTSKIVKTCDMGGNCNKDTFFTDGKYIYFIRLSQYFTLKNASDKKTVERILSSLKFIR